VVVLFASASVPYCSGRQYASNDSLSRALNISLRRIQHIISPVLVICCWWADSSPFYPTDFPESYPETPFNTLNRKSFVLNSLTFWVILQLLAEFRAGLFGCRNILSSKKLHRLSVLIFILDVVVGRKIHGMWKRELSKERLAKCYRYVVLSSNSGED
jgi:hypothetical protein